jgi:hypothetical protein
VYLKQGITALVFTPVPLATTLPDVAAPLAGDVVDNEGGDQEESPEEREEGDRDHGEVVEEEEAAPPVRKKKMGGQKGVEAGTTSMGKVKSAKNPKESLRNATGGKAKRRKP